MPWNSNANRARALARFFTFLDTARGEKSWRAATEADHLAFHQRRRRDEAGPHVEGGTWNQEVSLVNHFYEWAVRQRYVAALPIPHRARRPAPMGSVVRAFDSSTVPATYAHDENGERIEWMPPATYRLCPDAGLRGHGPDGLLVRRQPRSRGFGRAGHSAGEFERLPAAARADVAQIRDRIGREEWSLMPASPDCRQRLAQRWAVAGGTWKRSAARRSGQPSSITQRARRRRPASVRGALRWGTRAFLLV